MSRHTSEAGVVKAIQRAVSREYPGAWILKTVGGPRQASGVPDLLLCVEGRFIGLEVKYQRPGESLQHALGRATRLQEYQLRAIREAGGVARVVTTVEDALSAVETALSGPDPV